MGLQIENIQNQRKVPNKILKIHNTYFRTIGIYYHTIDVV